jgi:hypothetical protein
MAKKTTLKTDRLLIKKTFDILQPLNFKFAPRSSQGVTAGPGATNITLNFTVDPASPGRACNAWVSNAKSPKRPGGLLGTLDGGKVKIYSDCFA